MNIEDIKRICSEFPHTTEDIKWGHDYVFSVGAKMYCVVGLDEVPTSATFKVTPEEFEEMTAGTFFKPAPYVARYKWVLVEDITKMSEADWKKYLRQSYDLVKDKLPPKIKKTLI